jgi:hypothetical protein
MSPETPSFERRINPETPPTPEEEPLLPLPGINDERIIDYIHEHSHEVGFEGAKQHIIEILKVVQKDEGAVELINETLLSIFSYIESIYKMEVQTKMLSLRWEGSELADKIKRHDERRRRAHDALISNLTATTRYLNENFADRVPKTGIYNGDALHLINQNRVAIADWAIELEHEILLGRER